MPEWGSHLGGERGLAADPSWVGPGDQDGGSGDGRYSGFLDQGSGGAGVDEFADSVVAVPDLGVQGEDAFGQPDGLDAGCRGGEVFFAQALAVL